MSSAPRWKHRPPGSDWGDFGPDDQNGRLNLITPEKVRQAVAEVKEGLTFCLSLPLDLPGGNVLNPRRHPPLLRPTVRDGKPNLNYRLVGDNPRHSDVISDDLVLMHLQYSTQWDSFAHVGQLFDADGDGVPEPRYYNGYRPQVDIFGPLEGADARRQLEEHLARAGAGHRAHGRARRAGPRRDRPRAPDGHPGRRRHHGGKRRHGVPANRFAQALVEMGGRPDGQRLAQTGAVLDGRDARLLQWITDSGLSVPIADNDAVEAHPATSEPEGCCATLPLREHCLFKQGIHLGEIWHPTPLAEWLRAHGRHRFLLTAPPLRLPGAVGSPVTPVATV